MIYLYSVRLFSNDLDYIYDITNQVIIVYNTMFKWSHNYTINGVSVEPKSFDEPLYKKNRSKYYTHTNKEPIFGMINNIVYRLLEEL